MSDNCGCTCAPDFDQTQALVKSFLLDQINAGNLQPPLYGTNGQRLGQATVMTATETMGAIHDSAAALETEIKALADQAKEASAKAGSALQKVTTDGASVTGDGTTANPIGVAMTWLRDKLGSIFMVDGSINPQTSETDSVATTIVGDTRFTMGGPAGFIPHPTQSGMGIPLYKTHG